MCIVQYSVGSKCITVAWTLETINYYNDLRSNGFDLRCSLGVPASYYNNVSASDTVKYTLNLPKCLGSWAENISSEYIFIERTVISLHVKLQKKNKVVK